MKLDEFTQTMVAREKAMGELSLTDRVAAGLYEFEKEDAMKLASAVALVAAQKSGGRPSVAIMYGTVAGIEVGRELERRR